MKIRLAIFDMDGTVFESHLDWNGIRKELNLENQDILKGIYLRDKVDRKKLQVLERHERENTLKTRPIAGIKNFLAYLRCGSAKLGLITNNSLENTEYLLNKFGFEFDMVITREMKLWKPGPKAFITIMQHYRTSAPETISIGDSLYDIDASKLAKISNIFIKINKHLKGEPRPDVVFFRDYEELTGIIESLSRT